MEIFGNTIKCEPSDLAWITEQVSKMPHKHLIRGVLAKYSEVYASAEDGTLQQKGAARRNANARLRVYVNNTLESLK